jgi:ribosomal-protein-alanine N-acetyltransferase
VSTTRLISIADAPELAALLLDNQLYLAPWEPHRPDAYFTPDGQRQVIEDLLRQYDHGTALPHVIVEDGRVIGRVTLTTIVRGPFQSASLGYFVDAHRTGRGVATEAVRQMCRISFADLGLHRLEAGTLVHNVRSQRVLEHNGFQRYGLAPRYLRIAGDWQDHVLYQLLNE